MAQHHRAKLGPAGRQLVVDLVGGGASFRAAARAVGVSPATAHKWFKRWEGVSAETRSDGSWALDRSSRPRRSPNQTPPEQEHRICDARVRTNLGPGRLAGIVGHPRSTVWAVLHRHGISRRRRSERQTFRRYEWAEPGALLHMDVKRLARFDKPGHWAMGRAEKHKTRGAGWVFLHVVIDDHSRYAYVEQHPVENADTNAGCLQRALEHFAEIGLGRAHAVMTDNAMVYRHSRRFAEVLQAAGAEHILIPPYTPRWNGKAERFIRTLQDEWAYAHSWNSSRQRTQALRSFVRYYNRKRPHSSLGDRPPISRVHNLPGQDT